WRASSRASTPATSPARSVPTVTRPQSTASSRRSSWPRRAPRPTRPSCDRRATTMTDPFVLHESPALSDPVLVTVLAGWIDAGGAQQAAMGALANELGARTIATFDDDTFIDYRARRPVMELRDGVNTNLVWPTIELMAGRDANGHDALLLTGHEPD